MKPKKKLSMKKERKKRQLYVSAKRSVDLDVAALRRKRVAPTNVLVQTSVETHSMNRNMAHCRKCSNLVSV